MTVAVADDRDNYGNFSDSLLSVIYSQNWLKKIVRQYIIIDNFVITSKLSLQRVNATKSTKHLELWISIDSDSAEKPLLLWTSVVRTYWNRLNTIFKLDCAASHREYKPAPRRLTSTLNDPGFESRFPDYSGCLEVMTWSICNSWASCFIYLLLVLWGSLVNLFFSYLWAV